MNARSPRRRPRFTPRAVALAVATCFPVVTLGNPLDPTVVHGAATFDNQGNTLTVTNAPGAVIHWQSFSIGQSEVTRFIQESAASQVLNRVVGGDPSQILGTLQSNGQVFLINPNGILFGTGARVDVAGLVASTLDVSNRDFLAGRLSFAAGAAAGGIRNDGTLRALDGGSIYLIASSVENNGVVTAPDGNVILAAGKTATLMDSHRPYVQVEVTAGGDAINVGQLVGSHVGIYAGTIRAGGSVEATQAVADQSGRILFKASGDTTVTAEALVTANGKNGGQVRMESGGVTLVEGTVTARGNAGSGGTILILGKHVGLVRESFVDVSGATGGGTVLVGGDYQGRGTTVFNAQATFVSAGSVIRADAIDHGNGGRIIVWADDATRMHGSISARGGALGGDGGFVETSGYNYLDVTRAVDASAPAGRAGTWLLDPNNLTVLASVANSNVTPGPNFASFDDNAIVTVASILASLNSGTNVSITTSSAGGNSQAGDITIAAAINKTSGTTATLSLSAHNNIAINAGITSTSGALNLVVTPNSDAAGGGAVTVASSSTVNLNGGTLTLAGAGNFTLGGNTTIQSATIVRTGSGTLLVGNAAELDNVTLNTDLTVGSGTLYVTNNLTLGAGVRLAVDNGNYVYFQSANANLLGSGSVVFGSVASSSNYTNALYYSNSTAGTNLTLGPNVTVGGAGSLQNGWLYTSSTGTGIVNQGTISAGVAGKSITVGYSYGSVTNQGLMQAQGGTLQLSSAGGNGTWSNSGTLRNLGGALNLGGNFNAADVSGNATTGAGAGTPKLATGVGATGAVNLNGVLNLQGGTLTLDGTTTGDLQVVSNGTLRGGTLASANGARLLVGNAAELDNVTLNTDLTVGSGTLYVTNNLTLGAGVRLAVDNGNYVYFQSANANLLGSGSVVFGSVASSSNYTNALYYSNSTAGTNLTLGPNVTVGGAGSLQNGWLYTSSTGTGIVNQGTISAGVAGKGITVGYSYGSVTNQGLMQAQGGTLQLSSAGGNGTWSNSGTLRNLGGALNLGGNFNAADVSGNATTGAGAGTPKLATGAGATAAVNLNGVLNLQGGTLTLDGTTTGNLQVVTNGTLRGGTLASANGAQLLVGNAAELDNVTLNTDLTVGSGTLYVTNNLTLGAGVRLAVDNGNYVYFQSANANLLGSGSVVFGSVASSSNYTNALYYSNSTAGTNLTLGPNVTVGGAGSLQNGWLYTSSTGTGIVNQGTISAGVAGKGITVGYSYGSVTNQGALTADKGLLTIDGGTLDNRAGSIRAINAGTVDLATTVTTANLGTVNSTGGTVRLTWTGVLDNTGDTFEPGVDTTGSITLSNGTILGGTLRDSAANAATFLIEAGSIPRFTDVTLDFDLVIPSGQTMYVSSGDLTLANGRTLTLGSTGGAAYLYFAENAAQRLNTVAGGAAQVLFVNTTGESYIYSTTSSLTQQLTIGSGITIGGTGDGYIYAPTLVNQGSIRAASVGQNIRVTGYSFDNLSGGLVEAASGGSIQFTNYSSTPTEFTNAGTIRAATGGTIELDQGTFSGAFLSSLTSTGGTVAVGSLVDNSGQTLVLDPATIGNLSLFSGGTIRGGTITSVGGATLTIPSAGSVTLDNVTLGTDFVAAGGSTISVPGILTINAGYRVSLGSAANSATLVFTGAGTNSLLRGGTGTAELAFAAGSFNNLYHSNGTLDIGPGVLIHSTGGGGTINNSDRAFTNNGVINADVSGQTLNLRATGMTNAGTIGASNGGILNLTGSFTAATLGVVDTVGGTLRIGSGATFDLQAGIFAMTAAAGGIELSGGTIRNGTLRDSGAAMTLGTSGGTLDSVTLDQNLTVANRTLLVPNGLSIQGGRTLNLEASGALSMSGAGAARSLARAGGGTAEILLGSGAINASNTGSLTLGPGLLVRSGANGSGSIGTGNTTSLINLGTIAVEQAGRSITLFTNGATGSIDNQGLIQVVQGATLATNGRPLVNNNAAVGGGLQIGGTLSLGTGIALTNNGRLVPGSSPGLTTVTGNLVLGANSIVDIEVAGLERGTDHDAIDVSGTAALGGNLNVIRFGSYSETSGDLLRVITAQGGVSGTFSSINGAVPWNPQSDARNLYLQAISNDPIVVWNVNSSGTWSTAASWLEVATGVNRVPTGSDLVIIDQPNAIEVSLPSGTFAARRLFAHDAVRINGGTLTLGGSSFISTGAAFALTGGTLAGTGDLTVSGTASWSGGSLSGGSALRLAPSASLSVTGSSSSTMLAGRRIEIRNGATATFNGEIESEPGTSVIENAGTLTLAGARLSHVFGAAGSITVNNAGTLVKTGTGTYTLGADLNNTGILDVTAGILSVSGSGTSTGDFEVAAGATYQHAGGTQTWTNASGVNGAGTLLVSGGSLSIATPTAAYTQNGVIQNTGGGVSFAADLTPAQVVLSGGTTAFGGTVTTPVLTQSGGTLSGNTVVTLTGNASSWTGGTWTGDGTVRLLSGAALAVNGTGSSTMLSGRRLEIQSGTAATFNGEIESEPGASVIDNAGTLTLAGTRLSHVFGAAGTTTLNSTGTIDKTGTGVYDFEAGLNSNGTVNVQGGTLRVRGTGTSDGVFAIGGNALDIGGGTQTLSNAARLSGTGTLLTSGGNLVVNTTVANTTFNGAVQTTAGSATFAPALNLTQVVLSGGTTTFSADVTTAQFTQTGGALSGASVVTTTGNGSSWTGGTWTGNGTVRLNSGAALVVNGTSSSTMLSGRRLEIEIGAAATFNGEIELEPGTSVIDNTGTLTLAGTRLSQVFGAGGTISVRNSGTLVKSGTGTFILEATLGNNSEGVLDGSGTLSLAGATLTNASTIRPAGPGAIGAFNLTGNFVQTAGGHIEIETEGAGAGQSDRFAVSGNATLAGVFELVAINGYQPSGSIAYPDLMTYGSRTGTFGSIAGASFPGLTPTYGQNGLTLAVDTGGTPPVCPTGFDICWIGAASGSWNDGTLWSTGLVPTAQDSVYISAPGSITITAANGGTVNRLVSEESFLLTGGTFALNGVSSIAQTLTIAGGTFQANGTLDAGSIALSGGTLSLGTNSIVTALNSFAWTNGNIFGSGATSVVQIAAPATLTVSGGNRGVSNLVVTNAGQMNVGLTGGSTLLINDGASVVNSGTLTFTENNIIGTNSGSGSLVNSGTIAVATDRTGTIQPTSFSNDNGTLQASASNGILQVRAGTNTYNGTTTIVGNGVRLDGGTHDFTDGTSVNGTLNQSATTNFGTVALNGIWNPISGNTTIGVGDTLTLNGTGNWSGGSIFGSGVSSLQVAVPATLNVTGGTRGFSNVAVNNAGRMNVNLSGSSTLLVNDGASLSNTGTLNLSGTNTFGTDSGSGAMNNAGAVNVAGSSTISLATFDQNDGTLSINAGSTLTKSTGVFAWNGGTLGGGGALAMRNGAAFDITGSSVRVIDGLNLDAAALNLVAGSLELRSGNLTTSGVATIASGSTLVLSGGTFANSAPLAVDGIVDLRAGSLTLTGDANHAGRFVLAAGTALNVESGVQTMGGGVSGAGSVSVTEAILTVDQTYSAAATTVTGGTLTLNSAAQSQTMTVGSGGVLAVNGTTTVGTLDVVGGRVNAVGTLNAGSLNHAGGTTEVSGTMNVGSLVQTAGAIGGAGSFNVTTSFNVSGGSFAGGWSSLSITHAVGNLLLDRLLEANGATAVRVTNGALTIAGLRGASGVSGSSVTVQTTGDLVLQAGSASGASVYIASTNGPCSIDVGGTTRLVAGGPGADAIIFGSPDVGSAGARYQARGPIEFIDAKGGRARIESGFVESIYISFPTRSSGGYSVNGIEVTSAGSSGFFADDRAAILGQNLHISYGLTSASAGTVAPDPANVLVLPLPQLEWMPPAPPSTQSSGKGGVSSERRPVGQCR